MPVLPPVMSSQARFKGTSLILNGSKYGALVSATSTAVSTYITSASFVTSTNNVTGPGAGTFVGRVSGLNASAMSNLMRLKATSKLLTGRDIKKLFDAVSHGVVQAMRTAVPQGSVIGGGPGTGRGKILGLVPAVLEPQIIAQLAGRILVGEKMRNLVSCIAFGVCTHINTASQVSTTCIGAFAGPPAGPVQIPAAVGPGKIV